MKTNTKKKFSALEWLMTLLTFFLCPMAALHAQAVRVTAVNSANGSLYDVNFAGSGGSITPLNTDQSSHVDLQSIAFRPNAVSGQIDLIVADGSRGQILLYASGSTVSQIIWDSSKGVTTPAEGLGPVHPDGLSVDSAGNLFVASSAPGQSTIAEVWVLRRNPAGALAGGYDRPRLLDNNFGGLALESLVETSVATSANGFAAPGNLLVLAGNPAVLLSYSAAQVQTVLQGSGQVDPTVVLSTQQFPPGASPGGFAFWPADGSLLITTGDGRILRYSTSAGRLQDFASGLGNGKYKIKTGLEFGVPYAFVADNNGGDILKFGAPPATGTNSPIARVTQGVQSPEGLAVSNTGVAAAATCLSASGCDALGGVLNHQIRGPLTLSGSILEDACVLPIDPRLAEFGTCTGHSLVVANYCAGFPNVVIPAHLCGGSGTTGKGLALINTTSSSPNSPTQLVFNEADAEGILPSSSNVPCPRQTLGWWPKPDEGTVVEGTSMVEVTSGCGSSRSLTRTLSIWGLGLVLNEQAFPGTTSTARLTNFAIQKYDALGQTVALAPIESKFKKRLQTCLSSSRSQFDRGRLANAAGELVSCDSLVQQNPTAFTSNTANPNPFGEVRGRIANLYLTINTRLLGNPPLASWPPGA